MAYFDALLGGLAMASRAVGCRRNRLKLAASVLEAEASGLEAAVGFLSVEASSMA